jgi:glycosyltransferase involved in cell wall biosynthesis
MIPCYNAAEFLPESISSVQDQTYSKWELILVDDGSSDATAQVVAQQAPDAKFVRQDHMGIGAALNLALRSAHGEYLAWLDADDLWLASKLEKQLAYLQENPEMDGCFGGVGQFFHEEGPEKASPPALGRHRGGLLVRRASFFKVGPFRQDLKIGEFIDWFARADDAGCRFGQLRDMLYLRRIHGNNTVLRHSSEQKDYLKVLKAALDRRRVRS